MTRPTAFEKMRANRRRWVKGRAERILAKIGELESELAEEWRAAPINVVMQTGTREHAPYSRRLFGWLGR